MPMYDYKLLLSDSQHVANANAFGTNYVNCDVTHSNLAKAGKLGAHIVVTQAFANATPTYTIWIEDGNANANNKIIGRYIGAGSEFTAGRHFFIPLPPADIHRVINVKYVITTGTGGYGKVTAWIGPGPDGGE